MDINKDGAEWLEQVSDEQYHAGLNAE